MLFVLDLVHIVDGARVSTARHPVLADSGQHHSLAQAFLEPARLAPVSLLFCYDATVLRYACVHPLILHSPLEKTLAALARDDAIVQTSSLVFADHADLRLRIIRIGAVL